MSKRYYVASVLFALAVIGVVSVVRPAEKPPDPTSLMGLTETEAREKLGEPCHSVADYPEPGKKALAFDRRGGAPVVLYFGTSGKVERVTSQGQDPK